MVLIIGGTSTTLVVTPLVGALKSRVPNYLYCRHSLEMLMYEGFMWVGLIKGISNQHGDFMELYILSNGRIGYSGNANAPKGIKADECHMKC